MPKKTKYQAAATLHGMTLSSLLQEQSIESEAASLPKVELRPHNEQADESLTSDVTNRGLLMKCPSCGKRMELDVGFAGSVCRCNHCKALVTVPGELQNESETVVRRSDRPEAPAEAAVRKHDDSKASILEKLSALEKEKNDDDELRIPLPESMQTSEPAKVTKPADDPFSAFLTSPAPTPATSPTVAVAKPVNDPFSAFLAAPSSTTKPTATPTSSTATMSMIKQTIAPTEGSVSKLSVGQLWLIMGVAVAAGLLFALVVVEVLLG